jgi:outer membrane protein assembly factor BamE (lipoprotein component of BamABCDE complex)
MNQVYKGLTVPAQAYTLLNSWNVRGVYSMINKQKYHLLLFLTSLFLSACGVIAIHEKSGQYFPYNDSIKVKNGMTESEVMAVLGKPYVVGYEENGDIYYRYEWSETQGQSFVYGLVIMGEQRTVDMKGGSAEIRFEPTSKTVKKIEYKIIGSNDYNKLRGGSNAASR